jgi:2-polyprenyl-3-methyl-5-hydroxy-6-metoxy-1,4-benzoquinol methylase
MTDSNSKRGVPASLLDYLHACPVCSRTDLLHYCRVPSLFSDGEFIRYDRCAACGTVLRNPRLPADDRHARYEEKAVRSDQLELKPKLQVHYAFMMRVLGRLVPDPSNRRLLDFGCGAGGFLREARNAGFEVMGLELNRALARHVREALDIPVFQGLVSDPAFADERFNVIVSSQVFEHLVDPPATLMELRRHLIDPGIVLIEVPNLLDIRERLRRGSLMDDSHLFYFSARSLSRMLQECGFRVVKIHQGLRPYRFIGAGAARVPTSILEVAEKLMSGLQVRTGLSVIARRV